MAKKKTTTKALSAEKVTKKKTTKKSADGSANESKAPKVKQAWLSEGDRVPSIQIAATHAEKVSLRDFSGRWLVLYFYPKDNTSGCTLQSQNFRDAAAQFKKKNATVFGVSPDSIKSHEGFRKKYELPFDLGADAEKTLAMAFGVWKEKSMYGRKYMGIERSTFLISPEGRIVKEWRKVKVAGHVAEVLSALELEAK